MSYFLVLIVAGHFYVLDSGLSAADCFTRLDRIPAVEGWSWSCIGERKERQL